MNLSPGSFHFDKDTEEVTKKKIDAFIYFLVLACCPPNQCSSVTGHFIRYKPVTWEQPDYQMHLVMYTWLRLLKFKLNGNALLIPEDRLLQDDRRAVGTRISIQFTKVCRRAFCMTRQAKKQPQKDLIGCISCRIITGY